MPDDLQPGVVLVDLCPVLRVRLRRFHKRLQNLRYRASPDSVHEFRIACRELLACAPLLQSLGAKRFWQRRLRKAIKALNQLRDLQQMQERLLADQISMLSLEKKIGLALHQWQRYQPELHSRTFSIALQDSAKRLERSRVEDRVLMLGVWHSEWLVALAKVKKRLLVADAENLKTLHRLRIRYKSFRYLLELLIEAGFPLGVDTDALRFWQAKLGEVEDFRVMAKLARKLGGSQELQDRFACLASERALAFIRQKDEFAHFLSEIEQQVFSNYDWSGFG